MPLFDALDKAGEGVALVFEGVDGAEQSLVPAVAAFLALGSSS